MSLCWLRARCIFRGMPIAVVLAESEELARKAAKKITVEIDELEPVTDPRVAAANGDLIVPPKKFVLGDTSDAFTNCEYVFEGKTEQNGQEHLYIETQGAYAVPTENGGLKIYSSTQGPTAVQRAVCRVTGLQMHQVEVDVQRLGGGFGGKEDQANAWAGIVAVAAQLTKRPVKYAASPYGRHADDRQTASVFVGLQDRPRQRPENRRLRSGVLPKRRSLMRPLAAGARTHAFSLHKFVFHPERHRDRLLLPDKSPAEYSLSRIRWAAGDVCDRIGDRSRRRKTRCLGKLKFNAAICSKQATNSLTARSPRAKR